MTMISVVIPTHNRPEGLKASLDSLLAQTVAPTEVLVIDDGSNPPVSKNVFRNFPKSTKTVLLRNSTARGANNARNRGVRTAKGDFIAFLDDDDQFKKTKIEILISTIEINNKADVIYHPACIHMT